MHQFKRIIFVALVALSVLGPVAVFAVQPGGKDPPPLTKIDNPLGETRDLRALILKVVDGVAEIGYYVVIFFIIYSGFRFVSARGNEAELKKAKEIFLYTVIGAAILLGATLLATVIQGTVDQLKASAEEYRSLS